MAKKRTPLEEIIDSIAFNVEFYIKKNTGDKYLVKITNKNSMIYELVDVHSGNPIFIENEELELWSFIEWYYDGGELEKEMTITV